MKRIIDSLVYCIAFLAIAPLFAFVFVLDWLWADK